MHEIGSFYHPAGTRFIVWAPLKKQVDLVIEFPQRAVWPMQKSEWGYWEINIQAEPGTRYRYRIDKKISCPDPASQSQPEGVHGASELLDRNHFLWTDQHWKGMELATMIIYELHTGAFSNQHDFSGVHDRLDYLVNLGVNAIELMPVAQFPGDRNWGYDGVFSFAVQHSYGGADGLKQLVDAAHKKNIAVILDVVYNHIGPEGNYFDQFGPYFTDKYKNEWGQAINFDGAWCDGPRNYFISNALMWLDEFHIDGLRLDAVHAICDRSAHHFIQQLKEEVIKLEERTGCAKVLIAEIDLNDPRYINDFAKGGYGLDGQWTDEFHHALHALLTGERSGYYEDFGHIRQLEKAFRDSWVYTGEYSQHRKRCFGADAGRIPFSRFIVFSQNHDQIGNRPLGDRLSRTLSFEELKVSAATVLLSPYIPLLFMGEEYGERHPFLFFADHSDKELIRSVREDREKGFVGYTGEGQFRDPLSVETFNRSTLSWEFAEPESAALMHFYQYLIDFRKTRIAMQARTRDTMKTAIEQEKIIILERTDSNDHLLILFNYGRENLSMRNHWHTMLHLIFDSASPTWLGPGETGGCSWEPGEARQVAASSVQIYENQKS